ncbi:MAG: ATP-binding cassette domain-containing protein [Chloroflexi bacterium]|nr:ATP-binding cassette domain-containing protein [Chloroflexota bacterium]
MTEAIYQIEQLRKEYGGRAVIDLEQLEIHAGEIFALVGPSGAGKSTLLRLLNFLETPTSGQLIYRGQARNGDVPLAVRREITTVFQRPALLHGSVRENIAYGLRLRGEHANGRVSELLDAIGLSALAHAPATKLSGGEMQRVALARALVIEPRVLLLDEPTANLDPYNVGLIEEIVREHNRARGTTVVVVTHNVFQAKRLAQRVGLMLGGRLVEVQDNPAFFDTPRDSRTAAFVRGEMVY